MLKDNLIQTFDPYELESDLFRSGVNVHSFITPAHHIFHINRVEDYFKMVKFPLQTDLQPRRITVFNFFFLTKGVSTRSKGLDTYHFGENTFFFIPAYQITTHEYMRKDVEGFYCHFNIELLTTHQRPQELFNDFPFLEFNSYPLVTISHEAKALILPIFERLFIEYSKGKNCNNNILRAYLLALFTELQPFYEISKKTSLDASSHITDLFKKALSQHIYQKQKITDYADMLSVTPNHLNKCIKKTMGKSAHDLLSEMLILEAKVLLKQTNMTVSEIAYKIGRNEISDFARFFKVQTGMKPSEYRNLD